MYKINLSIFSPVRVHNSAKNGGIGPVQIGTVAYCLLSQVLIIGKTKLNLLVSVYEIVNAQTMKIDIKLSQELTYYNHWVAR